MPDGELLPGIDDEWAETEREAYRERQGARFRGLAEQALAEGRTREAVDWARRRCAVARWDESAHRALVRALLADGDRAGAADAAQRFTERLRADLGVAPSPTTRSLHADVASGAAPRAAVSIFGRTAELGLLDAAWRATTRGSGRVVVRHGRTGDRQDHPARRAGPPRLGPWRADRQRPRVWTSAEPCRSGSGWSWPAGWPRRCRPPRRRRSGRWS